MMFFLRIPAILMALTVHELAHGVAAKYLGDETAEKAGRLSINPLSHLDFLGTLMLLFGPFGWAKPVPVNPSYFKNPKRDMAIVAFAGPLSNILFACVIGLVFKLSIIQSKTLGDFLSILFVINIGLAFFNLLPIYPLDGSNILVFFLNPKAHFNYMRLMRYVPFIFIALITIEWITKKPLFSYIIMPIFLPFLNFFMKLFS